MPSPTRKFHYCIGYIIKYKLHIFYDCRNPDSFIEINSFHWEKNERIHGRTKNQAHKRQGTPLQEGGPTTQNHVKRIIAKNLRNWSPKRIMIPNNRPNLPPPPSNSPKHPPIPLIPQNPQDCTNNTSTHKKTDLFPHKADWGGTPWSSL